MTPFVEGPWELWMDPAEARRFLAFRAVIAERFGRLIRYDTPAAVTLVSPQPVVSAAGALAPYLVVGAR